MRSTRQGLFASALFLLVVVVATGCSSDSGSSSSSSSTSTTKASTTTTTRPTDPNSKLSSDEIKQIQTNLHSAGCFGGAIDGVIGPITRAGISAFQKAEGLTVDGQYGSATKSKLTAAVAANKTVCTTPTTTTSTQPGLPPCTSTVIAAALPNYKVLDFGCDSGWAWAGIDTGPPDGYESVALLKANGMTWQQVDRATYCVPASNIPPDIYQPACTVS